jgi:hypothetical protein
MESAATQTKECVYVPVGSIVATFVAQTVCFFGVQVFNVTTMACTTMAFPIIRLILERSLGRVKLSSPGIHG